MNRVIRTIVVAVGITTLGAISPARADEGEQNPEGPTRDCGLSAVIGSPAADHITGQGYTAMKNHPCRHD